MDLYNKPLDTNGLFVGGAGLFLQYFDVVKPIYLYATMSLVLGDNMGLPTEFWSSTSRDIPAQRSRGVSLGLESDLFRSYYHI